MSDVSSEIEEELEIEESIEKAEQYDDILNLPINPLHVPLGPVPASDNDKSSEDYSFSFDEEEAYSDDFEKDITKQSVEVSQSALLTANPALSATKAVAAPAPPVSDAPLLPSLSAQSLAAEVLLQKLSREVVHLRQQQRDALKLKQQQAIEKKQRAAERRTKYNTELQRLLEANESLTQDKEKLEITLRSVQSVVATNESKIASQLQTISQLEESLAIERNTETQLREKIAQVEREIVQLKELQNSQNQIWQQREASLNKENMRLELQVSVVTKQCNEMESRMKHERETLPQHHQIILNERLEEVKQHEARLHAREAALVVREEHSRVEYERKIQAMKEEYNLQHSRLMSSIERERVELAESKQRLHLEMQKSHANQAEQLSAIEAKRVSLRKHEAEVQEREVQLERERTEFAVAKRLVEPQLKEASQDREAARVMRQQAEKCLEDALAREQHTRDIENSLHERESQAKQSLRDCERLKREYSLQRDRLLEERQFMTSALSTMKEERNKLQKCSVELFRNLHVLHNALLFMRAQGHTPVAPKGKVTKFNTLSSMLQSIEKATSSMQQLTSVIDEPPPDIIIDESHVDHADEIVLPPSTQLSIQQYHPPTQVREESSVERSEEFAVNRSYYSVACQDINDSVNSVCGEVDHLKSFAVKYGVGLICFNVL